MIYIGDLIEQANSIHYMAIFSLSLIVVILLALVALAFFSKKIAKKVVSIILVIAIGIIGTIAGFHSYDSRTSFTNSLWAKINEASVHTYESENIGQDAVYVLSAINSNSSINVKAYKDGELTTLELVFDGDNMHIYELVQEDFE